MARRNINPWLDSGGERMISVNQYTSGLDPNKIYVTFSPTAGFTVALRFTFASGTITIDWKDGSAPQNFTSTVDLTHTYAVAGDYIAEISGSITNITTILSSNRRITKIQNLKTGTLSSIIIAGNASLNTEIDLSNCLLGANCAVQLNGNTSLPNIKFKEASNGTTFFIRLYGCNFTTFDFRYVPVANEVNINSNPNATTVYFKTSGNYILASCQLQACNFGTIDLSNVPIGGASSVSYFYDNPNLTGIIFASSGNGILKDFRAGGCNLDYINLASGGMSLAANSCSIRLENNSMAAADVNHILVDLYSLVSGEPGGGSYTGRIINIGGTNVDPDASSGGYDGLTAKTNLEGKGITVTIT